MTQPESFLPNGRRAYVLEDGTKIPRNWDNLCRGMIPVEELDREELAKGALRDKNGRLSSMVSRFIPRDVANARVRLIMKNVEEQFAEVAMQASEAFIEVLNDDNASHKDKMEAAKYLHERFLGKVPDRVELQAEVKPWEGLVGGVLREVPDDETSA